MTQKNKPKLSFIKEDSLFTGAYSPNIFRNFLRLYKPWKYSVVGVLILGLIARFLILINVNLMGMWVDSIQGKQSKLPFLQSLQGLDYVYLIVTLTLIGMFFTMAFRIMIARIGTHAVSVLYDEISMRVSRLPMVYFDANPVGRLLTRFSGDYGSLFRIMGGPMGEILSNIFDLLLMSVLILHTKIWSLPLVIVLIFVYWKVYRSYQPKLQSAKRLRARQRGPVTAHFVETIQGAKLVQLYGKEESFLHQFSKKLESMLAVKFDSDMASTLFLNRMVITSAISLFVTSLLGWILVRQSLMSIGEMATIISFIMMISVLIQGFFDWMGNSEDALAGLERMSEFINKPLESGACLPANTVYQSGQPIEDESYIPRKISSLPAVSLVIENLTFQYRPELPVILKNIHLNIQPGEYIGIVGKTGCGKSSLVQAIFHLYDFNSGRVLLQGFDALAESESENYISLLEYRSAISLIPQEPILFARTLRENLQSSQKISDEQMLSVLKRLGFDQFSEVLGDKPLDFKIHEGGANLSAGQRQLVSLARCLLQDAPLVIMDEATSAIDPVSEQLILKAIREVLQGKTRIVIAHRLETILSCDRIIRIENGEIKKY